MATMPVMAKKKTATVPINIRIPKALKDAIEKLAEENRRPMSTEFIIAVEKHLTDHDRWPRTEPKPRD